MNKTYKLRYRLNGEIVIKKYKHWESLSDAILRIRTKYNVKKFTMLNDKNKIIGSYVSGSRSL